MLEIEAMRFLIGVATLIFVAEDWCLRDALSGPRAWSVQRRDLEGRWYRRIFDVLYSQRGLTFTLAARAAASLSLLISPHPIDAVILIVGHWLWSVRWRGTFNGGSDAMTLIVLVGVLINLLNPAWERFALIYVGVHLIASFVVAGLAKLRNPEWRSGVAPRTFAADAGVHVRFARAAAWAVIAFEITFPLAVLHPFAAWAFVGVGLIFHVVNAYVFGLNRFLLAWAAAYPALIALAGAH